LAVVVEAGAGVALFPKRSPATQCEVDDMSVLSVRDVNKRFGGLKALDNVNLEVEAGTVHAIIGPNGAGKSTLLNCFVGRLEPDTGSVTFDGKSLLGISPHEINQTGVSRVFQTPEIFGDLTLMENVMIPAFAKRDGAFKVNAWRTVGDEGDITDKAMAMLEELGLGNKSGDVAGQLSRGDKRRLELAMCLVQDPKLLLLDEPTAGMARADTNATVDLLKTIASKGITMVVIEHDMHVVFSLADKITVLAQGTPIAEGLPAEIRGNEKVQEAYLGGAHL
jgi:branched-chain amino acid transport system ATP-binding protein